MSGFYPIPRSGENGVFYEKECAIFTRGYYIISVFGAVFCSRIFQSKEDPMSDKDKGKKENKKKPKHTQKEKKKLKQEKKQNK